MNISKKRYVHISVIALLLLYGGFQISNYREVKPRREKIVDSHTPYEVVKVVDGDTFEVRIGGNIEKVRMIGVDTPETVDPRKEVQCFGKEASLKTKELLLKKVVYLHSDPTQSVRDRYGRILAYVYYNDLFINKYLIEEGYAHEYTYNIPYTYQRDFKTLERKAREEKRGLWGGLCSLKAPSVSF